MLSSGTAQHCSYIQHNWASIVQLCWLQMLWNKDICWLLCICVSYIYVLSIYYLRTEIYIWSNQKGQATEYWQVELNIPTLYFHSITNTSLLWALFYLKGPYCGNLNCMSSMKWKILMYYENFKTCHSPLLSIQSLYEAKLQGQPFFNYF